MKPPVGLFIIFVGNLLVASNGDKSFKKRVKAGREKGLKGYDLVSFVDPFYGRDTPDFNDVIQIMDTLAKSRDNKLTVEDFEKVGLPTEHFHYFDKDKDGELNPDEAYFWFMQREEAKDMDL